MLTRKTPVPECAEYIPKYISFKKWLEHIEGLFFHEQKEKGTKKTLVGTHSPLPEAHNSLTTSQKIQVINYSHPKNFTGSENSFWSVNQNN